MASAQKAHWQRLLIDCRDETYVDAVRRIGATHFRMHIEPRWFIAGYTMIANRAILIIAEELGNDTSLFADLVCTLNRHVAIDMDLALTVYTAAAIE